MATYGEEGVGNVAWSYPRKIERCESFAVRTTCKVYLIYHEEIRVFQAWNISADIKAAVVQKSCPHGSGAPSGVTGCRAAIRR